ncbi:uncharacterized protein LOC100570440 isoform X2 [Acyrthosiphon pisum]|uniref:Uncharacterized protein n=1 Tax=Acyrthosiphon pisum TaxID=7029 RepID=A0A8R2HB94_ACYPI|nr:uncharacterized protein LOC100570440 isoform X2 [Acyrthosiphon pisum]|eukprot:XP_016662883.1 PREDICTED: uncharacterized protein LOC100570440 isoform X2 [Acyrthosiphon pisum]
MADATHKTLSDGVKRWKSIYSYLNLMKYMLRIFCYFAAVVMFQISSFLEVLSDYLKSTEKAEDSHEKTIEKRCDANSFSNQTNKNEELKEVFKVINDTVNELIDRECDLHSNHMDKNEEQKGENKVIGDIANGLIDNVTEGCNGQSVFDCNKVAEQKIVNEANANIVNCKLNEECDSQYYDGVEQKPTSQIPGKSREITNSENSEEKVKEEITTSEDIGSARVKKRQPIKNTAMLLITKTINENKLMDKRFKFKTKYDKDKMSNKETPNGNPYQDKDNIFTNKSDSFKSENKLSLNNEPEKTDCFEVANNSNSKDTSIGSASMYKNDSKNLDIHKNIEPMENQYKINGNQKLVTKNNVDHRENDDGNESRSPITKTEIIINENNGELLKNHNDYENKEPITTTENMITKNNDVHWKDFDNYTNSESNTKSENMITSNNGRCWENDDGIENRKPTSMTENMTTKNNTERWENNNSHEYKKPITKTEKKILNIFEVKDDIFGLPSKFSLAHCVCEDFHSSMGMTAEFKYKFGKIGALMDQQLRVSDVGHIIHNEQHVFYIVIKRKMNQRPLLSTLEIALCNLRNKMNDLKLTKLAIPKYGLDSFNIVDVKEVISKIFTLSDIEVTICLASSKFEIEHFIPPKVNYTFKQLWEMEKQTDIIIFINMKTVYSENWYDEVVERINTKYPFKERLLKDINIKPMAHGDFLMYKIDTEILFCVFIKPFDQYSAYFRCLEKAFQEMKSHLTGYRYLGVQQEPYTYKPNQLTLSRCLAILKSVFSNQNAEIWICGDTEQHKAHHYQQYKKIVNDAIEPNPKRNSKTNTKSKNRPEKKRHGNNSRHDLSEKHYSNNISDVNSVTYLNQEQISVDNYKTENWDN